MNDFELESKLKSVPLPVRSEDYWGNFPAQVCASLRRASEKPVPRNLWFPRLAWIGTFAMACMVFSLSLWPSVRILLHDEKMFRRELASLPKNLRTFMADEHGMHYLVADQE